MPLDALAIAPSPAPLVDPVSLGAEADDGEFARLLGDDPDGKPPERAPASRPSPKGQPATSQATEKPVAVGRPVSKAPDRLVESSLLPEAELDAGVAVQTMADDAAFPDGLAAEADVGDDETPIQAKAPAPPSSPEVRIETPPVIAIPPQVLSVVAVPAPDPPREAQTASDPPSPEPAPAPRAPPLPSASLSAPVDPKSGREAAVTRTVLSEGVEIPDVAGEASPPQVDAKAARQNVSGPPLPHVEGAEKALSSQAQTDVGEEPAPLTSTSRPPGVVQERQTGPVPEGPRQTANGNSPATPAPAALAPQPVTESSPPPTGQTAPTPATTSDAPPTIAAAVVASSTPSPPPVESRPTRVAARTTPAAAPDALAAPVRADIAVKVQELGASPAAVQELGGETSELLLEPETPVELADADPAQPQQGTAQAGQSASTSLNGSSALAGAAGMPRATAETAAVLAAQIAKRMEGRSSRFDIELDPVGLGKVNVTVEIGPKGQISAALAFERPQSAAELSARSGELRSALEKAGFDVSSGGLSFQSGSGGSAGQQAQDNAAWGSTGGRAFDAAARTADQADAIRAWVSNRSAPGGVDIRI